jgi:hypothetical protein
MRSVPVINAAGGAIWLHFTIYWRDMTTSNSRPAMERVMESFSVAGIRLATYPQQIGFRSQDVIAASVVVGQKDIQRCAQYCPAKYPS